MLASASSSEVPCDQHANEAVQRRGGNVFQVKHENLVPSYSTIQMPAKTRALRRFAIPARSAIPAHLAIPV